MVVIAWYWTAKSWSAPGPFAQSVRLHWVRYQPVRMRTETRPARFSDQLPLALVTVESWPLATMPLVIHCGERVDAQITMKNTGTKAWNADTRLGTTMPRDRESMFADDQWLSPDRPAAIDGTVAPGDEGTFSFSFQGPTGDACVPGTYHEHFGLVQENVAWFSNPPEDQIEALIQLEPGDPDAPPTTMTPDDEMGGGCSTGHGGGATSALLVLGVVLARRRRAA